MPADFSCCDTLNAASAEPRLAGHHALCPRFGLVAIEERVAHDVVKEWPTSEAWADAAEVAMADRAVLLTALREATTPVDGLRFSPAQRAVLRHYEDNVAAEVARLARVLGKAERADPDLDPLIYLSRLTGVAETALREAQAEVQRLRPIVEELAALVPIRSDDLGGEECMFCDIGVGLAPTRLAGVGKFREHRADCLYARARLALLR